MRMAIRASVFYPWKTFPFLTINQFEEECAIGREGNETTLHLENCTSYIGIRLPTLSGRGDSLDVQLGSVDISSIHCLLQVTVHLRDNLAKVSHTWVVDEHFTDKGNFGRRGPIFSDKLGKGIVGRLNDFVFAQQCFQKLDDILIRGFLWV